MSFPDSLRKTKSRLKVWEILSSSTTPLTARQIAQKADGGNEEKAVWLSSVYRALEAFEKAQAVNRTLLKDSPEALYSLSETGHHHYAICMNCKSRTELEGCPFGSTNICIRWMRTSWSWDMSWKSSATVKTAERKCRKMRKSDI